VRYQLKPPLEYNADHLAIWLEAKKRGRLPRLSGSRGIPQKRTWGNPSRLRVSFAFSPQTDPAKDPKTNAAGTRGTPAPETTPRPLSAPLSQHPTPRLSSPRPSQPSKPSQKTHVGELASRPPISPRCEVGHRERARAPPRPRQRRDHRRPSDLLNAKEL
jgi:hypothetical protein